MSLCRRHGYLNSELRKTSISTSRGPVYVDSIFFNLYCISLIYLIILIECWTFRMRKTWGFWNGDFAVVRIYLSSGRQLVEKIALLQVGMGPVRAYTSVFVRDFLLPAFPYSQYPTFGEAGLRALAFIVSPAHR